MRFLHVGHALTMLKMPQNSSWTIGREKIGHFLVNFWPIFCASATLGVNFRAPKLAPIVSYIKSAIVRHDLRNISGSGLERIGPPGPEVQGKMSHFQKRKL